MVRVSNADPYEIGRALDAGARGVIVPVVRSVADAERAAAACRFPPEGTRSWATTRSKLWDTTPEPAATNASIICVIMIETGEALDDVGAIAALAGVDVLFAGPGDLRLVSLGPDGLTEACRSIVRACKAHGKVPGVFAGGPQNVQAWRNEGFEFIAMESDSALLLSALQAAVSTARSAAAPPASRSIGT